MVEERFYRWLGYALFTASLTLWLVFDHNEWELTLIALTCLIAARVIRLERRFKTMLAASQKALDELNKATGLAVRNKEVSQLDP